MKNNTLALMLAGILCFGLTVCTSPAASTFSTPPQSSAASSSSALKGPPLNKDELNWPVSDFLTEEQQNLYLQAHVVFSCFQGSADTINSYPAEKPATPEEEIYNQ